MSSLIGKLFGKTNPSEVETLNKKSTIEDILFSKSNQGPISN